MSHQESSVGGSARGPPTRLRPQPEAESGNNPDEPLPSFQPFPARTRDTSKGDSGGPPSGTRTAERDSASRVARGGSHRTQTIDQSVPYSRPGPEELEFMQRRHTPTLPEFTPFPAAAPSSRYAPPHGSRVEPARPLLHSASNTDTDVNPQESTNTTAGSSAPPVGHLSSSPGQYSPYAAPGPLTARPHICEQCNSGFARAHDLKRHLDIHKGERPHKCPNCQRGFSRKDAVRLSITVPLLDLNEFDTARAKVQRHLLLTHCGSAPSGST